MTVTAIVLAAGRGERFGGDKVTAPLRGKPVWRHSFETFLGHPGIHAVGIVANPDNIDEIRSQAPEAAFVVLGGATRQASARIGVESADSEVVLLHDAARPGVTVEVIDAVLKGVADAGSAAACIPVTDTIRRLDQSPRLLDRSTLVAMQTPQGAIRSELLEAYAKADREYTDDIALLEASGATPALVPGDPRNQKLTHPSDMKTFPEYRTGIGYDVHAFSDDASRPLMLGGVHFPGHPGLEGHSDADALAHAIVDALLGGAGLGDIGKHFPPSDPRWSGEPSKTFLSHAKTLLNAERWSIVNVDATVIAEFPKIMIREIEVREKISEALGIETSAVSIKATTNERLGALGRGEGIAAFAVATIVRFP